jgi:hypothetical protein
MTEDELKAMVAAAQAAYDKLSQSEKLRHNYMQRRSFVRGMCPEERDYSAWCDHVDDIMPHHRFLSDEQIGLILAGAGDVGSPSHPEVKP